MSEFTFDFTLEQLDELFPRTRNIDMWYDIFCEILPKWDINTVERVSGFIAQCAHESANFTVLTENLNYSATALNRVFPKYFVRAGRDSREYHRQPEKIANVVYANRMDNGSIESGDGWKYRGRGLIQITGKYNYTQFAKSIRKSINDTIEYASTPKGSAESACWFWDTNNLNFYADMQDIISMTKRINGGLNGFDDRKKHYYHALDVFAGNSDNDKLDITLVLRVGSRGETVRRIQEYLDIEADGIFGPSTEYHLKRWQMKNNLVSDGIAGPKTFEAMGIS